MKTFLAFASLVAAGCATASVAVGEPSARANLTPHPTPMKPLTTRVSVSSTGRQGNYNSYAVGISANGRYVVFNSDATNLVPGDTNHRGDVFVHDRATGRTTRISVSSSGHQATCTDPFGCSGAAGISADGRYVGFVSSAANLVAGDTNGASDIFVRDRWTRRTALVSVSSDGRQANATSGSAAISADSRYVAFVSAASNLVPGDSNGVADVFVRDLKTGRTSRLSVTSRGGQANSWSDSPAIGAHGRYVAFTSSASNLVAGDTNNLPDVFVHDRATGQTRRVSVGSHGTQAEGARYSNGSNAPSISADGRYVAFHSDATNLVAGDTNGVFDIFVRDRRTGSTTRISVSSGGAQANAETLGPPTISADGRYVAFGSLASNLVADDNNDITDAFMRDRRTGRTTLVSLSTDGRQGGDSSWPAAISANDRYLAFSSWASNLVAGDSNPAADAFVRYLGRMTADCTGR